MRNLFENTVKILAFTLSEVVLVMGIIGVVGVLGVSNAKKDTDTSEKVSQLKKTYGILDAAFSQAVMENGTIDKWGSGNGYPSTAELWTVINPYLQFTKKCGTAAGCWKNTVPLKINKQTTNTNINTAGNSFAKGILSNNVSIAIVPSSSTFIRGRSGTSVLILVDVNGKKGLNMMGNDIFAFEVDSEGSITPLTATHEPNKEIYETTIDLYKTPWVLQFGNMDYLKSCANSLSWTGNHTCR